MIPRFFNPWRGGGAPHEKVWNARKGGGADRAFVSVSGPIQQMVLSDANFILTVITPRGTQT